VAFYISALEILLITHLITKELHILGAETRKARASNESFCLGTESFASDWQMCYHPMLRISVHTSTLMALYSLIVLTCITNLLPHSLSQLIKVAHVSSFKNL